MKRKELSMVDTGERACPVCGQNATVSNVASMTDGYSVACRRCGRFLVPGILLRTVLKGQHSDSETKELLPYLSAYTRQATERGEKVALDPENWKDFAVAHKHTPFSTKVTKLLEVLAARSRPGIPTSFDRDNDFPLVDIESRVELGFVWDYLYRLGYVSQGGNDWFLTPEAWQKLESSVPAVSQKCFVAMSFDPSLVDAYKQGIYLATKMDCKLDPMRMDFEEHNDKICDKIIVEIRACRFTVADVHLATTGRLFRRRICDGPRPSGYLDVPGG
ncbi:MAG: hypothetical protein ACREBU_16760 [Nitrososphaera sp.]